MNIVFHVSAAVVDMAGSYTFSLVRAMLTCCVPLNEFGKIYSVIAALDNLLPIGLTQAYATVWQVRLQRSQERLSLKWGLSNFFPFTPSVSQRQGTRLARPDPWPQIEGTLHFVPV